MPAKKTDMSATDMRLIQKEKKALEAEIKQLRDDLAKVSADLSENEKVCLKLTEELGDSQEYSRICKQLIEFFETFLHEATVIISGGVIPISDSREEKAESVISFLRALVEKPKPSESIPPNRVLVDKDQLAEMVNVTAEMRELCIDLSESFIAVHTIIGGRTPKTAADFMFLLPKLLKKISSETELLNNFHSLGERVKDFLPFVLPKEQTLRLLSTFKQTPEIIMLTEQIKKSDKLLNVNHLSHGQ